MHEIKNAHAAFKNAPAQTGGTSAPGWRLDWNNAGYMVTAAVALSSVLALVAVNSTLPTGEKAPDPGTAGSNQKAASNDYVCIAPNTGIVNRMSSTEARALAGSGAKDVCLPAAAVKDSGVLACTRTDDGVQTRIELTTSTVPDLAPVRDRTLHTLVREKFNCAYE